MYVIRLKMHVLKLINNFFLVARKFGAPGMPEILAHEACWVLISH